MTHQNYSGSDMPRDKDRDLVFQYLGKLFKFAELHNIRFPGRSPYAALAFMENWQRGQWVAYRLEELFELELNPPLPTPEVCEILKLNHLKVALERGLPRGVGGDEAAA